MNTASNIDTRKGDWFRLLFLVLLFGDLVAVGFGYENVRYVTKPLLIPVLAAWLFTNIKFNMPVTWIVPALFFSWAGDCLLMFEKNDPLFFLLGLSSFLIAHICYIIFFFGICKEKSIRLRWWWLVVIIIYYAVLIYILYPYLGEMKIPVIVYGIAISAMLFLALQMLYLDNQTAGLMMAYGAVLFILSDSVLAFNKFYISFNAAGIMIMLTYGLAQLLIVAGTIALVRSLSSGRSPYLSIPK